jgi:type VI secretion system protein ImpG
VRDELLFYYERELSFLRHLGGEFAQKYPKVAGRLLLEPGKCEDPHVERILEGFALLAARIHLKLNDEFPEIVEALLSILYPQYLSPVPSMSVVQFHLDPEQGALSTGLRVARHTPLFSRPVSGVPCQFRTAYETTLWPVKVASASWKMPDRLNLTARTPNVAGALVLRLDCFPDVSFAKLELSTLRFFLQGDGTLVHTLIELLCNNCVQIIVRDPTPGSRKQVVLDKSSVRQVGFAAGEDVLPYPRRAFVGYRLLQEYFSFPEKFCFIDLSGFEKLAAAGITSNAEILFLISEFERGDRRQMIELGVSAKTFRLGCTPIVNLFPVVSEPIRLEQSKYEYRIVPDARREQYLSIHSVDHVTGVSASSPEPTEFRPFYSYRHQTTRDSHHAFWHISRRPSGWRSDGASDVYITFVDLSGRKMSPDQDTATLRLTCTNGEMPSRLSFGNEDGDFQLDSSGPIAKAVALVKPTEALLPPARQGLMWRLISQLSLNYLSLGSEGVEAFREILRLHNFNEAIASEQQIQGILAMKSSPHFTRVTSQNGINFARGTRVEMELDEEQFVGSGVYTFSAVLDVFLGLYASLNSFSQLVVRTRQRKGILKQWTPRAGEKPML